LLRTAVVIAAVVPSVPGAGPQPPAGKLTIEALLDIRHPSLPAWSPDGTQIVFVWERAGVGNLFRVEGMHARPGSPQPLTRFDEGHIDSLFWNKDGRTIFFARKGDLWQIPADGSSPPSRVLTTSESEDEVTMSPDGTRIAFVRGGSPEVISWQRTKGDLWVRSLVDGRETQLTRGPLVVSAPSWSPDGERIAFLQTAVEPREETPGYSGAKIRFSRVDHLRSVPAVVPADGGTVATFAPSSGWDTAPSWLDASRLLLQRVSADSKARDIIVSDLATGREHTISHEVDAKFWSLGFVSADPIPSPDGKWVAFVSDRDGWDHLYVASTAGAPLTQITKGKFEVRDVSWSGDGTRLAFTTNEGDNPGAWHLGIATLNGDANPRIERVTSGRGTNVAPRWSPTGQQLLYQHTDAQQSADLYLIGAGSGGPPAARITESMPAALERSAFVAPQLVQYRAPDGTDVPAYLFIPDGLDRSRKHPAIVWIHGDGINQNYDGWHVQRNYAVYYSFHQYLLQQGYVVLAPDYRGSIGYGRDWRQGVYMDVGGKDATDAVTAAEYLRTLDYVDGDRIGVWGLSYGGYFTLIALADRPTLYRCGVDVAGVGDYRTWFLDPGGAWVISRMGTPETNPKLYRESAVADRLDRVERPLLVLHGTADVNVPYLESVRIVDELLKHGKRVDFMMYPGEFHYFERAHVLRDAWTRVERFFEGCLRQ
jgi:dipeptidyl aminopeptidase/acylaminoacyl peptidase